MTGRYSPGRLLRTVYDAWTGQVGLLNKRARDVWLEPILSHIPAGARILDAGAGQLQYKRFCSHLHYVSQDFAQYDGAGDGVGLQTQKWDQSELDIICDIVNVPEPDANFDAIMCIEVFEHLPNPLAALQEFSRLLKPGGYLILTAPFCALTHFAPYFYCTGFSEYWYHFHLPRYGFEIEEIVNNGNYFEYLAQEIRRLPYVGRQWSSMGFLSYWFSRALIALLLGLLRRQSERDTGSDRLLSYGWHVLARKMTLFESGYEGMNTKVHEDE